MKWSTPGASRAVPPGMAVTRDIVTELVHISPGSCLAAPTAVMLPSLPSFSISTPVLCIEGGSVSCSFAILVALGLNLIFFFSTSIFFGSAFLALQLF